MKEYGCGSLSGCVGNSIPFSGGLSAASRGSPGLIYAQQLQQPNSSYDTLGPLGLGPSVCQGGVGMGMSKKSRQSVLVPSPSLAATMSGITGPKSSLWR